MKTTLFFVLGIAALVVTCLAISNKSPHSSLSPTQIENLEALTNVEYVPNLCCVEERGSICFIGQFALADSKEVECP